MSVRGTILDTLATQLATITVANGYASNVESVLRKMPHSEELSSSDPYLVIVDTGPDAIRQYGDGNKIRADMSVTVVALVRGAAFDDPPTGEISSIISDLRKLVQAPISLGSYVRFVELADVPSIFTGDTRASIHFQITIDYWYDADSP